MECYKACFTAALIARAYIVVQHKSESKCFRLNTYVLDEVTLQLKVNNEIRTVFFKPLFRIGTFSCYYSYELTHKDKNTSMNDTHKAKNKGFSSKNG